MTTTAIKTFYPRRGRVSARHEDAAARLRPRYGLPPGPVTSERPLVLEIGSGMGDATAAMAAADPGRDYLAVEVHFAGVANLLSLVEEHELDNVRVYEGDAVVLLTERIAPGSLDAVHIYFPDPWPKPRHHKRRIIRPELVALIRSRLAAGGVLHCATDWAEYAEVMLEVLSADPGLENTCEGFAARPEYRVLTKFEQRGVEAGREIFDLVFRAVPTAGS
ncbi:tRNA (guanosine(46)-N7)-methyltransferase TrmB [Longispora albida]|uniref:tRNA (guanosine(46)-N7)-methyltransferase TrmB n=1 Tax=Longispora albida TaxID=203523 RepID=UPI00316AE694